MASLFTVLQAIRQQVQSVTTGLVSQSPDTTGVPINVEVGLYWPSARVLQNNVKKIDPSTGNLTAIITVYDRGLATDSTRWLPQILAATVIPATLTALVGGVLVANQAPHDPLLQPLASIDITFAGPITLGDAAGIVLADFMGDNNAVVPIAGATETPESFAAQAAALIAAHPVLSTWVSAAVVGATLALTSLLPSTILTLTVNIGNGGTQTREIGRRKRHFQVVTWARTPMDRLTVTDPIEALIATIEADFGLTFADGTMGRLTFSGDQLHDEATLSDTMRRDFMVCVEYPITTTDAVYAVLAPIVRNTTF